MSIPSVLSTIYQKNHPVAREIVHVSLQVHTISYLWLDF